MKALLRAGVTLLACVLVAQCQTDFGCFEGDINFNLLTYGSTDGILSTAEGPVEVCIDGNFESVCDIGFDLIDAEAVCRYEVGFNVVTEVLTGLGTPRTSYASRTYNCSEYDYGLRSCDYSSGIHPNCSDGDHVAGVRCRQTCTSGDLRLRNVTFIYDNDLSTYQGRVDVCTNGTYLPICDLGWDQYDAQVACRYIYGSSYIGEVAPSFPLSPSSQFFGQEVMCNGSEYSLSECGYNPPSSPQCSSDGNRAAAAICRQVCSEGDVRLVNQTYTNPGGLNSVSGVVQVCINQQYVYVCADNWDYREAEVVCRSISSSYEDPYYVNTAFMTSVIYNDAPIYRYSMCNGTEYGFSQCQLPRNDSSSTCPSIAAVNCTEVISRCYSEGSFRLFNETTDFDFNAITVSGRIEVCSNFSYQSVCYQNWDSIDADVFCKSYLRDYYGYSPEDSSGRISPPSQFLPGNAGYALFEVICNGSESSINDCEISNGSLSLCHNSTFGAAGVICSARGGSTITPTISPTCPHLSLRLVNFTSYITDGFYAVYEGNVEVCLFGTYTAICDVGWDDEDAHVACSELDVLFGLPGYRGVALNGLTATTYIGIENITCPPNATASQCVGITPPQSSSCFSNSSAAGVRCIQERSPCLIEGGFGIVNISYGNFYFNALDSPFSGRVGICQNGLYSSVCDVNWDENDATALCNSLGIGGIFDATPLYGLHSGPDPIILESVDCTGREDDISACPTSTVGQISDPLCRQSNRAAGVRCVLKPGTCVNGQVRLADGPGFYEGRLEVCIDNQWHTVCETGFDDAAAYSVCNERQFLVGDSTALFGSKYGSGTGPIATVCSSDEFSPYSTTFSPFGSCSSSPLNLSCSHELDVGVRCSKGQVFVAIAPVGSSGLNSSSFALQSSVTQFPWDTTLVSSGWYDTDGKQILGSSKGGPVSENILQDEYSPTFFNFTYFFRGQLNFDHPLNVDDAGYYSFNISVRLTYPDNSSTVLSNSSTYALVLEIPPPSVEITSEDTPVNNRPYTATCVATFPVPVPLGSVVIEATDIYGINLTLSDRITFSSIRQIDERTFARDLTVNPITFFDSGTYVCSASLRNNFIISHPDSAYINVTVLDAPLPAPEVIGLCTNVVWYVPAVSCEGIQGYDVRLFQPQSAAQPNVTRRVGSNATFYILQDHHQMGRSRDGLYVQVRVIHSNGVGEWSEGTSIGCESPTPTPTPETPSVYFEINREIYFNNSAIPISEIGEGDNAIYCRTNKVDCCGTRPNRFGEFYYPNGVKVPVNAQRHGFYRNRGEQTVRLNRREGVSSPTGTYRCEVPNADGDTVKIYITLVS